MFRFTKKAKTPDKYDDVDWHEQEDVEGQPTHIALMYVWLSSRGYILEQYNLPELQKAVEDRTQTPSQVLDYYADGKLMSSMIESPVVSFLNSFYDEKYLNVVENDDVLRLERTSSEALYNVADTWSNADAMSEYLDRAYLDWRTK